MAPGVRIVFAGLGVVAAGCTNGELPPCGEANCNCPQLFLWPACDTPGACNVEGLERTPAMACAATGGPAQDWFTLAGGETLSIPMSAFLGEINSLSIRDLSIVVDPGVLQAPRVALDGQVGSVSPFPYLTTWVPFPAAPSLLKLGLDPESGAGERRIWLDFEDHSCLRKCGLF